MEFKDIQDLWQSQSAKEDFPKEEDVMQSVLNKSRKLRRTVFWRDVREVVTALFLSLLFLWIGLQQPSAAWAGTWYAAATLVLAVGVFLTSDHLRQRRKERNFGDSLTQRLRAARGQVDHQIWLLRNVIWWYLAPLGLAALIVLFQTALGTLDAISDRPINAAGILFLAAILAAVLVLVVAVFLFIYRLNQKAVEKDLIPRRRELDKMLKQMVAEGNKLG